MIHKHQHFDLLGKIVLERVIFTPPLRLLEKLDNEACLLYSIKGNSTLFGTIHKQSLEAESSVLMKCGNYFNHWHTNKDDSRNEAVAIHFYPDLIRYVYKDHIPEFLLSEKPALPIEIPYLKSNELIKSYVDGLLFYFNNPQIVDEELIVLKVKELLNLLYKINSNNIRELLLDLFNPDVGDFKKIIQVNLYENLSVEQLAHLANLSLSSFKRKFKEVFSDSPASFIRTKRLEKAAHLLRVSDHRITDICFDCGFGDLNNFSKTFKKVYGITPTAFRKQTDELN